MITASLFRVFFLPSELQRDYAAKLNANGSMREFGAEGDAPLLWVIREQIELPGTKIRLRHRPVRCLHGAHQRHGHSQSERSRDFLSKILGH